MQTPPKNILKRINSIKLPPIQQEIKKQQKAKQTKPIEKLIKSEPLLSLPEEKPFEFLTQNEYVSKIISTIHHLSNVFKISTGLALNLLLKRQYKVEECYKEAFDHQKDKAFVDLKRLFSLRELCESVCTICLQMTESKELISLCCNHKFCRNCYQSYILSLMRNEGIFCFLKTCPMENCKVFSTDINSYFYSLYLKGIFDFGDFRRNFEK